jgi:hypothetical protein
MKRAVHQLFLSDPRGDNAFLDSTSRWLADKDAKAAGVTVGDVEWQVLELSFGGGWLLVVTYDAASPDDHA